MVKGFIRKAKFDVQPQIISVDVLKKCSKGLAKRIRNEKYPDRKRKLKLIREEIDFLIGAL